MVDPRAHENINTLVATFFSALDNRAGTTPRLTDLTNRFTDKATIIRCFDGGAEQYTVKEFAIPRIKLLTQGALLDFYEREISSSPKYSTALPTARHL